MLSKLIRWAVITAFCKNDKQFAVQQISHMGKTSDALIVFPWGFHANPGAGVLALRLAVQGNTDNAAAMPTDPKAKSMFAEDDSGLFHPPTGSFFICRAGGGMDIETGDGGSGNVNVNAAKVNLGEGGAQIARIGDTVQVVITGGSSAGTYNGTITSGGENTSI